MTVLEKLELAMMSGELATLEDFVMNEVPPLIKANEALQQRIAFLELDLAEAQNKLKEFEDECKSY